MNNSGFVILNSSDPAILMRTNWISRPSCVGRPISAVPTTDAKRARPGKAIVEHPLQDTYQRTTVTSWNGIRDQGGSWIPGAFGRDDGQRKTLQQTDTMRSEEHTSELQSPTNLVCRLLLE